MGSTILESSEVDILSKTRNQNLVQDLSLRVIPRIAPGSFRTDGLNGIVEISTLLTVELLGSNR